MTTNKNLKNAYNLECLLNPARHGRANGNGSIYNNFFPEIKSGLSWLAQKYQEQSGIRIEFQNGNGPVDVDQDINFLLFHSTYELLSSIYENADAKNVLLSIERNGKNVKVSVEEDGEGFDVNDKESLWNYSKEHRLLKLNEELKLFGGRLNVESRVGEGTRVTVIVPPYAAENCGTSMIV